MLSMLYHYTDFISFDGILNGGDVGGRRRDADALC